MMVVNETVTPSHITTYDGQGGKPVYLIPRVAIERMIKRERLIAPNVSGDFILKNVLGIRRREAESMISSKTDTNSRSRDANTPRKKIVPPRRRYDSTDMI
jgi:hypothetical protein